MLPAIGSSFYRLELWSLFAELGRELPGRLQALLNPEQLKAAFLQAPPLPSWSGKEQLQILGALDTNGSGFLIARERYGKLQAAARVLPLARDRYDHLATEIAIWLSFLWLYRHINGLLWIAAATNRVKAKLV